MNAVLTLVRTLPVPRLPRVMRATGIAGMMGALACAVGGTAAAAPGDIPRQGVLPDGRGWEKVSPQEKNGFDVASTGMNWTLPSGDATAIKLRGVAPGSTGGRQTSVLKAVRDPQMGWSAEVVNVGLPEPLGLGWSLAAGIRTSPVAPDVVF